MHDRFDEEHMAETMLGDRQAREAARGRKAVDRPSYLKGVHDAIAFLEGVASAGVSHKVVTGMMGEMSNQTSDDAIHGSAH